jgi:bifunctional non-homologous end joining protein LigD
VKDATWVAPKLVAQVAYTEWTGDEKLRQPSFLGLRDDKKPKECRWDEREI